ncbi:MAG: outer membrane beta-barrel family protein [Bacteroidota bacterium]
MKKLIAIACLLNLAYSSLAQINYAVKGTIRTTDNTLPSGNIIALNAADSTFIKGDFFLDGTFELSDLTQEKVLLQFSSLEFTDHFVAVQYNQEAVIDLGMISVKNGGVALDEVVVKGKRPVYRQRDDGTLEVLIQNTTLAASNSVNEILQRTPDVILDENGQISVFGKGNVIFYLNGKRIFNNQLALIIPTNIKKIEVIRNPSAKYDADGAAVIQITTIDSADDGYQATVKQNVTYSDFGGTNTNTSINFNQKNGRWSTNGFYALQLGKDRELLYTTRNRTSENTFLETDVTTDWQRRMDNFSTYGIGVQLDGQGQSYTSLEYTGFYEKLGGQQLSFNEIEDDLGVNFYESTMKLNEKQTNHTLSLNHQQSFDTLGTALFLGGQYANFTNGQNNFIEEQNQGVSGSNNRRLQNIFDLNIDIYSAQADFTKIFANKNSLEMGVKYSLVKNGSDLDFKVSTEEGIFESDPQLSNFFRYDESISAGYFSFQGQLPNDFNYALGLRGEWTNYELLVSNQQEAIQDHYLNLFPNISLNRRFSDKFSLNFAYTASIARAGYQDLSPVLIYQDPYTSIQGNPNLIPEKRHIFELISQINQWDVKIGYQYMNDPFGGRAIRGDTDKSYVLKAVNYESLQLYYASVSKTFSNKWWTSQNTLNVRQIDIRESVLDAERVEPRPNLYFYTHNTFKVQDLFNVEVFFWYLNDYLTGITHRQQRHSLGFTLEKSFFDNSLKCRLIANDIFHKNIAAGDYAVGQTDIYFNRRWTTNTYQLSVLYNFGRLKKSGFKNKAIGASESGRVR